MGEAEEAKGRDEKTSARMMLTRRKNKSGDEIRWVESGFFNRVVIMLVGDEERTFYYKSSMVVMVDE